MIVRYIGFYDGLPHETRAHEISTARDSMGVVWLVCVDTITQEETRLPFYSLVSIMAE